MLSLSLFINVELENRRRNVYNICIHTLTNLIINHKLYFS